MSTGENINAMGSALTGHIIRTGFRMFPQTETVWLHPEMWPQIGSLQTMVDYPFKAKKWDAVPPGEAWFVGTHDELLGRVINIGKTIEP